MADGALQAALINPDRVRRTTDIPLFYGRKGKDTIQPQQYIERLEKAARVTNWAEDQRRCDEFTYRYGTTRYLVQHVGQHHRVQQE